MEAESGGNKRAVAVSARDKVKASGLFGSCRGNKVGRICVVWRGCGSIYWHRCDGMGCAVCRHCWLLAFARADLELSTDFRWTMVSSRWFHLIIVFGKYEWRYLRVIRGRSSIYRCSECRSSFRLGFVTGTCFCLSWSG